MITTSDEDGEGTLGWRCLSDGLNVILHVGSYMGGDSDDDIRVRYRFDKNQASAYMYWRLFPGQNEVAYMRMANVDAFTREAVEANELVVEAVDPLDGESRRYHMSVTGFGRAIGVRTLTPTEVLGAQASNPAVWDRAQLEALLERV